MSDHEDELLEYETEADTEPTPVLPVDPVPVKVCDPVVTVETVPQHATCTTFVLDTDLGVGVVQILPQDVLRVRAVVWIAGVDDPSVILCHSRNQAQDAANVAANTPRPSGALLTPGYPITVHGAQELWAAATSATASRLSVIAERRTP